MYASPGSSAGNDRTTKVHYTFAFGYLVLFFFASIGDASIPHALDSASKWLFVFWVSRYTTVKRGGLFFFSLSQKPRYILGGFASICKGPTVAVGEYRFTIIARYSPLTFRERKTGLQSSPDTFARSIYRLRAVRGCSSLLK